ncbi:hypothetical protein, partial [Priestia megaterium]|uniref:hypothetical protein n=1 Tax=Priestia megaterium TaxID=1404 RepID=UPI001C9A1B14
HQNNINLHLPPFYSKLTTFIINPLNHNKSINPSKNNSLSLQPTINLPSLYTNTNTTHTTHHNHLTTPTPITTTPHLPNTPYTLHPNNTLIQNK